MTLLCLLVCLFAPIASGTIQANNVFSEGEFSEGEFSEEEFSAEESDEVETPVRRKPVEIIALKNNLLYDAAATPNLSVEVAVAPRWTLALTAGFNPFPLKDDKYPKWRHLLVMPEARYWFCQTFYRDFLSIDLMYSHFNAAGGKYPVGWLYPSLMDYRKQGDLVAAGAAYGWSWILAPHWSIEVEGGLNVGYAWYDEYECKQCGESYGKKRQLVLIPRFAVNIIWQIR